MCMGCINKTPYRCWQCSQRTACFPGKAPPSAAPQATAPRDWAWAPGTACQSLGQLPPTIADTGSTPSIMSCAGRNQAKKHTFCQIQTMHCCTHTLAGTEKTHTPVQRQPVAKHMRPSAQRTFISSVAGAASTGSTWRAYAAEGIPTTSAIARPAAISMLSTARFHPPVPAPESTAADASAALALPVDVAALVATQLCSPALLSAGRPCTAATASARQVGLQSHTQTS